MATIDPDKERRRLAEFYSRQMDGELEKVAGQAYELTELAREALTAELARRGLHTELAERAPVLPPTPISPGDPVPEAPKVEEIQEGEVEFRQMVTIRQFRDL